MTVKSATFMDAISPNPNNVQSTSNDTKKQTVSFSKVMNQSISANASNGKETSKSASSSIKGTNTANNNQAANQTTNQTKQVNSKSGQDKKVTQTKNTNSTSTNNVSDNKLNKQLAEVVEDIKDKIKDEFNISDEELSNIMASLGITDFHLLRVDNLKQLVLQISGGQDATSLLTNSDLLNQMNQILDTLSTDMNQITDDSGISDEVLNSYIDELIAKNQDTDSTPVVHPDETLGKQDQNVKDMMSQNTDVYKQNQQDDKNLTANEKTKDALAAHLEQKLTVSRQDDGKDASANHGNSMEQQKAKTTETVTQFTHNFVQTVQDTFQTYMSTQTQVVDSANVIRQIIDVVKVTTGSELQNIEIQLNPENLGKVNLSVTAKNGMITAQITAENEQVKKAIESQMSTLKSDFEQQGIKVDAVEVTIRGHEFESGQNLNGEGETDHQNGRSHRRHINIDELNDLYNEDDTDSEQSLREKVYNENSSVSYTA